MADEADRATEEHDAWLADQIRANRAYLPPGQPGQCEECGLDSGRLVNGVCATCREELGIG